MSAPRGLAILGSTGSIGRSTLGVVALHPEWYRVAVLGAHRSWQSIVEQAKRFNPDLVVLVDPQAAAQARPRCATAAPRRAWNAVRRHWPPPRPATMSRW
jgi:1-deoxy-D-xylulose-5-phosphate reductoisomerase